jgi:hypothetical protein
MKLTKRSKGFELALQTARGWSDSTLMEREPHELTYTFGISLAEANVIFRDERYRRDL